MDKHVKKTVVVTSTMPTSYPTPFEAAPTVISSRDGGLIITTYTSINGYTVIQTYQYEALSPVFMPGDIDLKINAINSG